MSLEKLKTRLVEAKANTWPTDKKIKFIIEAVSCGANPCENRLELTSMLAKLLLNETPDFSDGSDLFYIISLYTRL